MRSIRPRTLSGCEPLRPTIRPIFGHHTGTVSAAIPSRGTAIAWQMVAVLVVLAGAMPLLAATPAPLMDWPSHLARVWITEQVLAGDPFWRARYELGSFLIPNAVLDLGMLGLLRLGMESGQAATLFLLLVYAAFVGGAQRLATRAGAASPLTLPLAVTCFYGTLLFYGLVNYLAGLAATLWALSLWVQWAGRPWRRAGLAIVATGAIALCHLIAAAVFLGVVACLDLAELYRVRRPSVLLPCCAALLVLAGILAGTSVGAGSGEIGFNSGGTFAGLLYRKLVIVIRALSSGQAGPDAVMAVTASLLVVAGCRAWSGLARPWAVAVCGLLALAALAPDVIGEGAFFDARFVPTALLLLAAVLPLDRVPPRLALALAVLVVLRMGLLTVEWNRAGRHHAALDTELALLLPGSVLLASFGTDGEQVSWADEWSSPSGNIASLAVVHGVFVPSVFASAVQQPLVLRDPWRAWRHHLDMSTPERAHGALAALRPACERDSRINILMLHYRPDAPGFPKPFTVLGPPGSQVALIHAC